MATVLFSPEALNDLEEIKSYIQDDLENDIAAANTLKKIFDRILELESFPKMGALLNSVTNTDNSYRYLLCNNYTSKTNDDIKSFMDLVCRFHDECIKDWINN